MLLSRTLTICYEVSRPYTSGKINASHSAIYNRISVLEFGGNFETFDGYHQRAPKAKMGKGKALPPPVLEPPQLEPAQEEVNKTTNVKSIH